MQSFRCENCSQTLYFENSVCMSCGAAVGFSRVERAMKVIPADWSPCTNLRLSGCNWIPDVAGSQCFACGLTRTRPADTDSRALPQYYEAEQAKRRLVYELDGLGLPVVGRSDPDGPGLAFDLLSSSGGKVVTGHDNGLVTIDLAESDDVHRERVRVEMGEAYRTMLGHFRHEIGHHYWEVLVDGTDRLGRSRELFGDESISYADALERHYQQGPPSGWEERYVSSYATMHPWEDFAETFAHVLHIRDTLETAHQFGLIVDPMVDTRRFSDVVTGTWLPLTFALNQINRSMGADDLYPFVLAPAVIEKLEFVHGLVVGEPAVPAAS